MYIRAQAVLSQCEQHFHAIEVQLTLPSHLCTDCHFLHTTRGLRLGLRLVCYWNATAMRLECDWAGRDEQSGPTPSHGPERDRAGRCGQASKWTQQSSQHISQRVYHMHIKLMEIRRYSGHSVDTQRTLSCGAAAWPHPTRPFATAHGTHTGHTRDTHGTHTGHCK